MAMTPEQRRAKDAERKRLARAASASARAAARAAKADAPDASKPGTVMTDAVEVALAAMSRWIVDSDAASVAQARMLAKRIDGFEHAGEDTKMLSAHRALTRVLNDLGGTPTVRMQHELRSLKLAAKTEVPDGVEGEGEAGKQAGNVTQFKRPPKRKRG